MAETWDLLFRGGRVIDGAGSPWCWADVAVAEGRIAAVGRLPADRAHRVIELDGRFLTPGFIDLHTHSDLQLLAHPRHEPKVMQGVTTEVIGHDGLSYAPASDAARDYMVELCQALNGKPDIPYTWNTVAEFLARFDRQVAVNVAYLLPHGAIRATVVGTTERSATAAELEQMAALVDEGMRDGAIGFSTGLTYAPCVYGDTAELVALCRACAGWGGVFMPHLRSYGTTVVAAHEEALEIARQSGIALHLTHHQSVFPCNRDRTAFYTQVIDDARAEGLDVTCDSYPYDAGSTFLIGMFPGWAQGQGRAKVVELLRDPAARERMRVDVEVTGCDGTHGVAMDWRRIQVSSVRHPDWEPALGRRIADLASERGCTGWEVVVDLLLDNAGEVNIVSFLGHEHAIQAIMRHPAHMVGSDGILLGARPHPRVYGTFPRYLARYVRELGVLSWEECIQHMTGASAARIGLVDRGLIRPGLRADLCVVDPDQIQDLATFDDPKQFPAGLPYVAVNGQLVKDDGEHTGVLAGRALRRGEPTRD